MGRKHIAGIPVAFLAAAAVLPSGRAVPANLPVPRTVAHHTFSAKDLTKKIKTTAPKFYDAFNQKYAADIAELNFAEKCSLYEAELDSIQLGIRKFCRNRIFTQQDQKDLFSYADTTNKVSEYFTPQLANAPELKRYAFTVLDPAVDTAERKTREWYANKILIERKHLVNM